MTQFITLADMDRLVAEATSLPVDLTPEQYKQTYARSGNPTGKSVWNDFFDYLLILTKDELGLSLIKANPSLYTHKWMGFDLTMMATKVAYQHVEFGVTSTRSIGNLTYLNMSRPDGVLKMIIAPLRLEARTKNFRAHASDDQIAATARLLARSILSDD